MIRPQPLQCLLRLPQSFLLLPRVTLESLLRNKNRLRPHLRLVLLLWFHLFFQKLRRRLLQLQQHRRK